MRFLTCSLAALRGRTPCRVFVGLARARIADLALYRELRDRCHWTEGQEHAVVLFGFARGRRGEEVARVGDPRFGFERCSLRHFRALWLGGGLEVR